MLTVQNLTCGYGSAPVLRGVSFGVAPHTRLFLVGPNGCGKTTLLRAVAGLLPYTGTVSLGGSDAAGLPRRARARQVAFLSQLTDLPFAYTVYETVLQGRYAHRPPGLLRGLTHADRMVVEDCMARTGLTALGARSIRTLSGGQLQRVFLARAFAQEAGVILLDEPTNHLDLPFQLELMEFLTDWVGEGARAVVGVTHDLNLALTYADRLLLLREGAVFWGGGAAELELPLLDELFRADVTGHMGRTLKRWAPP